MRIDCETARQRMDEPELAPGVVAHLEACAACRAEHLFAERLAAAMATLPRAAAPESLAGRVMAELRRQPEPVPAVVRPSRLALRPWELGWLGAVCLLLLALIRVVLTGWSGWAPGWISAYVPDITRLPEAAADRWRAVLELGGRMSDPAAAMTGLPLLWICGAAAFAIALYLLLSWGAPGTGSGGAEDAHAF